MFDFFRKDKSDSTLQATPQVTPQAAPQAVAPQIVAPQVISPESQLAVMALNHIHDGVVVVDQNNLIRFINPSAATMAGYNTPDLATGLDYTLIIKIESKDGREFTSEENPLIRAIAANQPLEDYDCLLISGASSITGVSSTPTKRIPIALTALPTETGNRIITFRNIEQELVEENEQAEFISTASHEMRTPVATIDGYLTLCLNPQTATVDDRARGYLESAEKASKHLGKLFQDLLDVTKLDDGRIRPEFVPVELSSFVQQALNDHQKRATDAGLTLTFGAGNNVSNDEHRLNQALYASVDVNFLREVLDNLIDNAIKYTESGGSVFVNVVGDSEFATISIKDTGIGISAEDLTHIFQKFYRADNSDTREIGGTGLGLYIVKQRVEAMGGRVSAESAVGQGTVFYVALPRLSAEEYQKRMIAVQNVNLISNSPSEDHKLGRAASSVSEEGAIANQNEYNGIKGGNNE